MIPRKLRLGEIVALPRASREYQLEYRPLAEAVRDDLRPSAPFDEDGLLKISLCVRRAGERCRPRIQAMASATETATQQGNDLGK